jgi:hypothetical protein
MTNEDKKEPNYLTIFYIFIAFYSMFFSGLCANYYIDIFSISKLAIIEHSWFSIAAAFLFLAVLTTPIRLFLSRKLVDVSNNLFLYKSKEEQKKNFFPIFLLSFVLGAIFTTLSFSYYHFYGFIIELFMTELENDKLIAFLFFSYMSILTWFSLELLQVETMVKILTEDILKIEKLKIKTIIKIENLYIKKYTITTFRRYCTEEIFFPELLPLTCSKEDIDMALENLEILDKKVKSHRRLSLLPQDITLEHDLKDSSNLIYLVMEFRKNTLSIVQDKKEKMIKLINNEKIHQLFQKNINEANKYLASNKKESIHLHTIFNPLDSVNNDLVIDSVFKSKIKIENEDDKSLLEQHREYILEILRRV